MGSTKVAPAKPDFPYYAGWPVRLSLGGWLLVLALTAAGFAALIGAPALWPTPPGPTLGRWIGIALFVALPLIGLRLAAGPGGMKLFRRPRLRDVWIGLAFVPLTMAASGLVAVAIIRTSVTAANPSASLLEHLSGLDLLLFVAGTLPQLIGEELITLVVLLALLTAFHQVFQWPRRISIALAWILSAVVFAALHLPTYNWNLTQTFAVIGTSRLVLSLPYLITRNAWASSITHVANDWTLFAVLLAARVAVPT